MWLRKKHDKIRTKSIEELFQARVLKFSGFLRVLRVRKNIRKCQPSTSYIMPARPKNEHVNATLFEIVRLL